MNSGLCAEKQLPMSVLVTVRKGACPDSCVNLPLKSNMLTDHFGRYSVSCCWQQATLRPNLSFSNSVDLFRKALITCRS